MITTEAGEQDIGEAGRREFLSGQAGFRSGPAASRHGIDWSAVNVLHEQFITEARADRAGDRGPRRVGARGIRARADRSRVPRFSHAQRRRRRCRAAGDDHDGSTPPKTCLPRSMGWAARHFACHHRPGTGMSGQDFAVVDEFAAHQASHHPPTTPRAIVARLEELLSGQGQPETASQGAGVDREPPEWASRLVESQRARIVRAAQDRAAGLCAICYEPSADCFFHGDDPLG